MAERSAGLPSQQQVIELLDAEFARAGYDIEDVRIDTATRPPRITVIADGDDGLDLDTIAELSRAASEVLDEVDSAPTCWRSPHPVWIAPLTSEKHYRRSQGRLAEMSLADGSVVTGRIGAVRDGTVDLVVKQVKKGPAVREIALDTITKAVVQVEFSPPSSRELELAGVSGEETSA